MYIKGMVKLAEKGGHICDASEDYKDADGQAYLPHSCDAWVIGKRENVEMLIEDLKDLLLRM